MKRPDPVMARPSVGAVARTAVFWLLLAGGSALVVVGSLRQDPPASASLVLVLAAISAMANPYRPLGSSTLGLGAGALPVAALAVGPAPAGLVALVSSIGAWGLERQLRTREEDPPPERRGLPRVLSAGVRAGCAALVAGHLLLGDGVRLDGSWRWDGLWSRGLVPAPAPTATVAAVPGWPAAVAALLALLAVLAVTDLGERWLRARSERPLRPPPWPVTARSLLWDGTGFGLGLLFVPFYALAGALPTLPLLAALGALAFAAARSQIRASELERRVAGLESVGALAGRVGSGGRRHADLAATILGELKRTVDFSYVQLDIVDSSGEPQSWWASSQSEIRRGHADPGPTPPPIPGIHKRKRWVRLDRDLVVGERKLGRFRLWCDPRRKSTPDLEVLDHLVPQLASLVERSALDREARVDSLTGTTRRQVFDETLRRVYSDARDRGSTLAVILCDIDHFKRINDGYGHAAGDAVLRGVGAILSQDHRDSDLCCRYGGEEFAILLPETDGDHALATAERIRRRVEDARISHEGRSIRVTLSAGVAAFPELYTETSEELLMVADRALYAAKERGRNRCLAALGAEIFRSPAGARIGEEPTPREAPRL